MYAFKDWTIEQNFYHGELVFGGMVWNVFFVESDPIDTIIPMGVPYDLNNGTIPVRTYEDRPNASLIFDKNGISLWDAANEAADSLVRQSIEGRGLSYGF